MSIALYIYRSAMRCAKFGVAVCKASMLNCRGAICHGYMCIVLYMNLFGVMVLQRSMLDWKGSICHRYMCILLYIYRSAIRCAKFGVVVFKTSVLN